MPKLIDYPRTSYSGAWELCEVVDDTGGKCALETAARKLDRKVSGSFKAIIGSAVKYGLLTSKRELLSTTTLFKRIKHAYDKQEELLFHREAFLTPPLFGQICRKFRSRELPIQMLDIMLIREFGVEEINAQGVAKAFVDGCRMVGLLDEHNMMADIDTLNAQRPQKRELASLVPTPNVFRPQRPEDAKFDDQSLNEERPAESPDNSEASSPRVEQQSVMADKQSQKPDVIATLFGLLQEIPVQPETASVEARTTSEKNETATENEQYAPNMEAKQPLSGYGKQQNTPLHVAEAYQLQVSGPGVNTTLSISDEEDITLAIALLEKIRRQLRT